MDLIKSQKLKENRKRDNLINNILVHVLTTVTCAFLCSYGFCLPPLISSAESFAFVLLPQWKPFLVNKKTLFLVVNLIVIILVVDSRFKPDANCSSSSPVADLYDEYVERSKRLRGIRVNGVEESDRKEERAREVWPKQAKDKGERKSDRGIESKELLAEEPTRSAAEDLQETKSDECGESYELPPEEPTRSTPENLLDPKWDEGGKSNKLTPEELARNALDLKDFRDTKSDEAGKSDELRREELTRSAPENLLGPKWDEGDKFNMLMPEELARSALDLKDLRDTKSDGGGKSDELRREELTRRVEEFMTRVHRRRWLESSQGHS